MWKIVTFELIPILLIVLFITEIAIPLLFNKPLFGSFRKTKKEPENNSSIDSKIDETSGEYEKVKAKAEEVRSEVKKESEKVKNWEQKANDLP